MITASSTIDQIIRRLSELSTSTPIHWTRPEILGWVNDAIVELNLIAGELQDSETVSLNTSDNVYALSGTAIAPLQVTINGKYLQRESVKDLDYEAQWEASDQVASVSSIWCSLGLTKVLFHKRCSGTATVMALQHHTPVTDAVVAIPLRDEYVQAIQDFCLARAMFKEGGAEFQQGIDSYNRFLDTAQQLSGRNLLRRYPSWDAYQAKSAQVTLRSGHSGVQK